jgi:hypothetical protein
MRSINNPKYDSLLRFASLNQAQSKAVQKSWASDFRKLVLNNLPIDEISALYCGDNGRPTKELRALTGAVILQNLFNLTDNDTCQQYTTNLVWNEALNLTDLPLKDWSISPRTLWAHSNKLVASGLASKIMDTVNVALAKSVNVDFSVQRLDSVHIFSNMATLSRVQLFHRTTKNFLKNLKKNHKDEYNSLDKPLIDRYLSDDSKNSNSSYNFFGETKSGERDKNLTSMAQDIFKLITIFQDDVKIAAMDTFKLIVRLFNEQCVVEPAGGIDESQVEQVVKVKAPKEVPSNSLQNPSDPTAGYSGHKGKGYHA